MSRVTVFFLLCAGMVLASLPGTAQVWLESIDGKPMPVVTAMPQYGVPAPILGSNATTIGTIVFACNIPMGLDAYSYGRLLIDDVVMGEIGNNSRIAYAVDTTRLAEGNHIARAYFVTAAGNRRYHQEFYFYVTNKNYKVEPAPAVVTPMPN